MPTRSDESNRSCLVNDASEWAVSRQVVDAVHFYCSKALYRVYYDMRLSKLSVCDLFPVLCAVRYQAERLYELCF